MKPKFLFYAGILALLIGKPQCSNAQALTASGPTTFCQGGSVTLSVPLDTNVSYAWLRDTVLIAGQQSNLLTVTVSGSYRVVRSSVANCCDTSNSVTVQVNPLPTATIHPSGTITVYCGPQVPTLTTTPVAGATYQWYQNNVAISGATSSSYLPFSIGVYHVVVRNANNCMQSSPTLTIVGGAPPAGPVLSVSSAPCSGQALLQCTPFSGALNYHWYRDGTYFTATTTNSLVVTNSGSYRVEVAYTSGCPWVASNTVQATIHYPPTPTITALGPVQLCAGETVSLTVGSGYFVSWYRNGVLFASGISMTTVNVSLPGTYTCTETTWSPQGSGIPQCTGPSLNSIQVSMKPSVVDTITPSGTTSFCAGDSVILAVTSRPGMSYTWYRNNQVIASQHGSQLVARLSGVYRVKGSSSTACLDSSNSVNIQEIALPTPTIVVSGSSQLCGNDSVQLIIPAGDTVKWYRNGTLVNAGANLTSIWVQTAGNYHCVVSTVGSPGTGQPTCSGRSANIIAVTRIPEPLPPNLALVGNTIFSSLGGAHQWFRNGILVPGVSDSFLVTTASGFYQARRVVSSCYSDSSNTIQIMDVGMASISQNGINVYPNPTSGKFYVTLNESKSSEIKLRVYSMHGALVKENSDLHHSPTEPIELDLTSHAPGIYFLAVQQNAAISYVRLVLTR